MSTSNSSTNAGKDSTGGAAAIAAAAAASGQEIIKELKENDVLMGRGCPYSIGNMRFKQIVQSRRNEYLSSSRRQEKEWISRQVVSAVKKNGGRFLRRASQGGDTWVHVDPEAVLLKVKQTMRDRSLDNNEEPQPQKRKRGKNAHAGKASVEEEEKNEESQQPPPFPPPSKRQVPSAYREDPQELPASHSPETQPQPFQAPQQNALPSQAQVTQQQQQQQQQQPRGILDVLLQQQHNNEQQQQSLLLAELQRQEQERVIARMIEEQRLRNAIQASLQPPGGMSTLAGVTNLSPHLTGGLSGLASLASMYPAAQPQAANLMLPPSLQSVVAAASRGPLTTDVGISAAISTSLLDQGGVAQQSGREAEGRPRSAEPNQAVSDRKISSGQLAIEQAFERLDKNPNKKRLGGEYLELSLIEGCLLSVVCSVGIPQWTEQGSMDGTGGMVASSSEDTNSEESGSHAALRWLAVANLLKEKLDELKSGDHCNESSLTIIAHDEPSLTSRALSLAISFTKNPQELARMTIMLLEKMRIHSRIQQPQSVPLGSGRNSSDRDAAGISGDAGEEDQEALLEQISLELGRFSYSLNVSDGTGRPVASCLVDMTPNGRAEEELLAPMAALNRGNSRKILMQIACLSRLRAIFLEQTGQEIISALKEDATSQSSHWPSRPSWWVQQEKESITRNLWFLETLIRHGLSSTVLDIPTTSRTFPVPCLREAGLTEVGIEELMLSLTMAIHKHIQSAKRELIAKEWNGKLSKLMRDTDAM